jgi:hypothetical protein
MLDAGEMSSEHAQGRIARRGSDDIEAQGVKRLVQKGGRGV